MATRKVNMSMKMARRTTTTRDTEGMTGGHRMAGMATMHTGSNSIITMGMIIIDNRNRTCGNTALVRWAGGIR